MRIVLVSNKSFEVYFHGSEERLRQVARGDKIDGLEAVSVLISVGLGLRMEI